MFQVVVQFNCNDLSNLEVIIDRAIQRMLQTELASKVDFKSVIHFERWSGFHVLYVNSKSDQIDVIDIIKSYPEIKSAHFRLQYPGLKKCF